jgi:hypothetical protein
MSTTASPVSPSPFVIPHAVTTGSDPSKTAMQLGAARNAHQHALVMVSKGKVGGGGKKNKKSKKYSRKSAMKKRFSKKFRRSVLRRKTRKFGLHKKNKKALALRGGATTSGATTGDKLIIPSFLQGGVGGTNIINQLAGNHARTLAYSVYDGEVSKPVS